MTFAFNCSSRGLAALRSLARFAERKSSRSDEFSAPPNVVKFQPSGGPCLRFKVSFTSRKLVLRLPTELAATLGKKETEALGRAEAESGAALGSLEAESGRAIASFVSSSNVEHVKVTLC